MGSDEAIRAFIVERLERAASRRGVSMAAVDGNASLFEAGVIDSLGFLELVGAVESAFDLEIDFSELDPAAFTTLHGLVSLCVAAGD
ncbi:MAG: acyl carrier protein [Desulfovibrionaceae bacterium]